MLDETVFDVYFNRLSILFGLKHSEDLAPIYYEALLHLSDRGFGLACKAAIAECEWMPKPVWLMARAADLLEEQAERDRQRQPKLVEGGYRANYTAFADLPEHQQAKIRANLPAARVPGSAGFGRIGAVGSIGKLTQLAENNLKLQNPETADEAIEWAHQQAWVEIDYEGDRAINLLPKLREAS
jgi:hypothetical protein